MHQVTIHQPSRRPLTPALSQRERGKRSGITLLEVLFSMFVLAIGILSIASLIPVAKFLVLEAGKSDRSVSCAQTALAEVRNRNFLQYADSEPWVDTDVDGTADAGEYPDSNLNGVRDVWTYGCVIDPLFLATNAGNGGANAMDAIVFPYSTPAVGAAPALYANYGYGDETVLPPTNPNDTFLPRITPWPYWNQVTGTLATNIELHRLLGDRVFTWHDDLAFTVPDDAALRPTRTYSPGPDGGWGVAGTDDDGDGTDDEPDEAGWLNSDDVGQFTGDYSWIATVVPEGNQTADSRQYTVSVAVFYKRKLLIDPAAAVPSERVVFADFTGSGLSGGDVLLRAPDDTAADYLNIRPNQWLMLAGWQYDPGAPASFGLNGRNRPVFRWYRLLGAADIEPAYNIGGTDWLAREVTLAGPDWRYDQMFIDDDNDILTPPTVLFDADDDSNTGINGATARAFLFDDCVGVFERTIRLDNGSLWTN